MVILVQPRKTQTQNNQSPKIPNVQKTQGQNTQSPKIPKIEIAIPIKYLTASWTKSFKTPRVI